MGQLDWPTATMSLVHPRRMRESTTLSELSLNPGRLPVHLVIDLARDALDKDSRRLVPVSQTRRFAASVAQKSSPVRMYGPGRSSVG